MRRAGRRSIAGAVIALLISATLLASPTWTIAAGADGLRNRLLAMINASRTGHGVDRVKLNHGLSRRARRHTHRMIAQDRIFHSDLPSVLSPWNWSSGGENVGCASALRKLHRSLMRSPAHRANILDRDFRRIGIGVMGPHGASNCGRDSVWTTEIFYG